MSESARDLAATVRDALMMDALTGEEYEDALAALSALEKQAADTQAERDSAIYERNNAREDALAALSALEKQAADTQAERDSAIYERNNARIARKAWANSAAVADKRALAAEARAVRAEEALRLIDDRWTSGLDYEPLIARSTLAAAGADTEPAG